MKALSNLRWPVAGLILTSLLIIPSLTGNTQIVAASSSMRFSTQWHANTVEPVPNISSHDSDVKIGQTISVPIVLSSAPQGLAGFLLEVSMSDPGIALISNAEFPSFGLTYQDEHEGHSRIAAADLFRLVEAADFNSTIVTLNIMGLARGTSDIEVRVVQMDDDDGSPMEPIIIPGTVTVH